MLFTILIIKNRQKIIDADEDFNQKYGSLFEELCTKNTFCILWKTQQLYKMLFTCLILIYLDKYPLQQIQLLMLLQLYSEISLIVFKPNEESDQNKHELISELLASVFLLIYLMMIDLNAGDSAFYDSCGLFLIGTLFLALAISVIAMVVDIYQTIRQFVRRLVFRIKYRKALKYAVNKELDDTQRAPMMIQKQGKLEEIAEENEEEEDEDVKAVSFETENHDEIKIEIRPVIIANN